MSAEPACRHCGKGHVLEVSTMGGTTRICDTCSQQWETAETTSQDAMSEFSSTTSRQRSIDGGKSSSRVKKATKRPRKAGPMDPAEPWSRWYGESDEAWEAFLIYREMGFERSLRKVAERLGKSATLMGVWSSKWNWIERAGLWDAEQDRIRRQAQLKEIEAMGRRQAQQMQAMASAMMLPTTIALQRLQEDRASVEAELKALPVAELLALIRGMAREMPNIIRTERLTRGEPTDVVRQSGSLAMASVTVDNDEPDAVERAAAILGVLSEAGLISTITAAGTDSEEE